MTMTKLKTAREQCTNSVPFTYKPSRFLEDLVDAINRNPDKKFEALISDKNITWTIIGTGACCGIFSFNKDYHEGKSKKFGNLTIHHVDENIRSTYLEVWVEEVSSNSLLYR